MSVTARAQYRFGHAYLIAPLAVLALVGVTACSSGSSTSPGAGASGGAGATGSVVVAHAAGVNGEAVESLLKQFTAETGIRATGATLSDTDYGAKVQLVAKTGKSDYDVALGMPTDVFQLTAPSGIYSQLDTSKWDKKDVDAMKAANLLGTNSAISQSDQATDVLGGLLRRDDPPRQPRPCVGRTWRAGQRGIRQHRVRRHRRQALSPRRRKGHREDPHVSLARSSRVTRHAA